MEIPLPDGVDSYDVDRAQHEAILEYERMIACEMEFRRDPR
jgi:hypothetical protein